MHLLRYAAFRFSIYDFFAFLQEAWNLTIVSIWLRPMAAIGKTSGIFLKSAFTVAGSLL